MSALEGVGVLENSGVGGLSSEELKGGWFDALSDKVNSLATNMMRFFWKGQENYHYVFGLSLEGNLGQEANKSLELAKRFFIGAANFPVFVIGAPLAVSAHIFSGTANFLNSRQYRYLSGKGTENHEKSSKVLHLNACMPSGGLSYSFGGMAPAGERLEGLANLIFQEKPDIVCLSKISRTVGGALYEKLKSDYPHFFIDIGLNGLGIESGLFVASRDPLTTPPVFVPLKTVQEGDQKLVNKGLFIFETQKCWYVYTHLHPKNSERARKIREEQFEEIMEEIKKRGDSKPFILLGDLNIDKISMREDYQKMIDRGFTDPLAKDNKITHTDAFLAQLKGNKEAITQIIDYVLCYSQGEDLDVQPRVVDTHEARLSDHKAIVATIQLREPVIKEEVIVEAPVEAEKPEVIVEEKLPPVIKEEVIVEAPVEAEKPELIIGEPLPPATEDFVEGPVEQKPLPPLPPLKLFK